jgi:predicted nucleic acid-binding protein
MDDRAARRCASVFGISAIGTAGVVVLAKRRGLIPSVEQALRQLQVAGLWMSEALITQLAGEDR